MEDMRCKMSSKVFINWHTRKNTLNGPANVFESLVKEKNVQDDVRVISPESGFKEFSMIMNAFKEELASKERKTFYINADGLKLAMNALMLSKVYNKHEFFLICHGIRKEEDKIEGVENKKYYIFEGLVLKNFPNIITVSNLTKELIIKNYKRKKPVHVIYNGINMEKTESMKEIKEVNKEIKLIASGGMKAIKGIENMVELVEFINSQKGEIKVKLYIYGAYDDELYYEKIMNKIKERNDICYGGIISKEKLYEEYTKSHFTLSLSRLDSFNMSVLEGMSYGTPPVLNHKVGAKEIIEHKVDGFIVDEKTLEKLYEFFEEIYINPEKYSIMKRKCFEKAEKYTWKEAFKQYTSL
jgi:glycosyltransferase involved in cell wall biosynthesis